MSQKSLISNVWLCEIDVRPKTLTCQPDQMIHRCAPSSASVSADLVLALVAAVAALEKATHTTNRVARHVSLSELRLDVYPIKVAHLVWAARISSLVQPFPRSLSRLGSAASPQASQT